MNRRNHDQSHKGQRGRQRHDGHQNLGRKATTMTVAVVGLFAAGSVALAWVQPPADQVRIVEEGVYQLAQTDMAEPLDSDGIAVLLGAVPQEDLAAVGLVQIGQLLDPERVDALLTQIAELPVAEEGVVDVDSLRDAYYAELAPVAEHIRGCVLWAGMDSVGAICEGDFTGAGYQPFGYDLAECSEELREVCGHTDDRVLGHGVDYMVLGASVAVIDDRFIIVTSGDLDALFTRAEGLTMQLDESDEAGEPLTFPNEEPLTLETSAVIHIVGLPTVAEPDLAAMISAGLPLDGLTLGTAELRLTAQGAGDTGADAELGSERVELRLQTSSAGHASQLQLLLTTVLLADRDGLEVLGVTGADVATWLSVDGADLVLAMDSETFFNVVAAISIPAFVRYLHRSRSYEAADDVLLIWGGILNHIEAQAGSGTVELPGSVGRTPETVPCGTSVELDAELWTHPTWTALNFAPQNPHFYSYQFDVDDSRFTVSAFGDLDCDGITSTFQRWGTLVDGAVLDGGAYALDELE